MIATVIRIERAVMVEVSEHARAEAPNECCGLLIGRFDFVSAAVRARNLRPGPTQFLVDPADHFSAIRQARTAGLDVVGVYHSHIGSAPVPSETDLNEATYSEFLYLIVSQTGPDAAHDIRGYKFTADGFEPVTLVSVP